MTPEEAEQYLAARQWVAEQERLATIDSGPMFMKVFLPRYATEAPPPFHSELWGLLLKQPPYDKEWEGKEGLVVAAPRGTAKSTLVSLAYPLHQGCHQKRKFCVVVSNTDAQARSLADALRREFEDNDHINEVFGNLRGDRFDTNPLLWTQEDFTIAHTVPKDSTRREDVVHTTRYLFRGLFAKMRGLRAREARPDLLIVDDLENQEQTATPEQRIKSREFMYGTLLPMLDPKRSTFVAVGTILHHDSVLANLLTAER